VLAAVELRGETAQMASERPWSIGVTVRCVQNGAAWFWDSNDDGTYETVFVFTSTTKARHEAGQAPAFIFVVGSVPGVRGQD
jgi:hypothetical protein